MNREQDKASKKPQKPTKNHLKALSRKIKRLLGGFNMHESYNICLAKVGVTSNTLVKNENFSFIMSYSSPDSR